MIKDQQWKDQLEIWNQKFRKETEFFYKCFSGVCSRVHLLKFGDNWKIESSTFKLTIDDGLGFTLQIYDWFLPEDHMLYTTAKRTLRNITFSNLIKQIETLVICTGLKNNNITGSLIHHVVPTSVLRDEESLPINPLHSQVFVRAESCFMLTEETQICDECSRYDRSQEKENRKKEKRLQEPANLKYHFLQLHYIE